MPGASLANQLPPPGPAQTIQAAGVGGSYAAAAQITGVVVRIVSAATAGDSVKLPMTFGGDNILVFNDAAVAVQVFGFGNATINGAPGATGVSQPAGVAAIYSSSMEGTWHRFLQG